LGSSLMALASSFDTDEISVPHQSSHWWHPVHFDLSTIKILTTLSSLAFTAAIGFKKSEIQISGEASVSDQLEVV